MRMISTEIIEVDKKEAERLLSFNTYEWQRPIRERRLSHLIYEMNAGTFRTGQISIVKLKYDGGKFVLMNGQHQLTGVISVGKKIKVNLEKWECEDAEDAALLYRKFDNGGMRSLQNMLTPEAGALGVTWPIRVSNLVISAAAIKEGKRHDDKQFKIELLSKYLSFGKFLNDLLYSHEKGIETRHLRRISVIYPVLMGFEKSHEDCKRFWTAIRDGENLKSSMPEYKLRQYLLTVSVGVGRGSSGSQFKIVSEHEIVSKCIHAWNAFRKGQPTDLKYYSSSPIPKAI